MGRLTERDKHEQGIWVDVEGMEDIDRWVEPFENIYPAINKLAHYEDMEEAGRLIEQKYGTWLSVTFNKVMCSECNHIWNIMNNDVETFEHCPKCGVKMLTKEEAEAALNKQV